MPQLWSLYKEVQEYYEKGMRVPDDVTLLWCDDNWGNIRRLPTAEERKRSGGAGIYYHFDYVGGPRNYKWLNTSPITKIWEQMTSPTSTAPIGSGSSTSAISKPMEFPIEFFLHLAWDPERWPKAAMREYTRLWAERSNSARTMPPRSPTSSPSTPSTTAGANRSCSSRTPSASSNYQEADTVVADFNKRSRTRPKHLSADLPANQRDAFYQLVLYPTKASAMVNELYVAVGKNALYASQGRASANDLAAQATRAVPGRCRT